MTTVELAFEDARAFLTLWEGELCKGACFVPWARPLVSDEQVALTIEVFGVAATVLEGKVAFNDVDAWGQPGFVIELSDSGKVAASNFQRQLDPANPAPPSSELFATTALFHKGNGVLVRRDTPPEGLALGATHAGSNTEQVAQPDQLLEPGTLLDNRFQIESHIATGGMGEVYRALHVYLKRPIALKLLRHSLNADPDMWVRFQREAELVSQLESPHVVRVFDFGKTSAQQAFLAMEFVEGSTLDLLVKQEGHLPAARAVDLLIQICDGLAEAHAMGIIHRDLKPANVMLSKRRDGTPIAKILDFGIARIADGNKKADSLTQLGMVVGTPAYLAPEQALADVLDARTDIYALGCVAFELLTGRTPFVADSLQGLVAKHLTQTPVSPASVRGELSAFPGVCDAVLKALSKDRTQRFQDVKAFADALRAGAAPKASAFDDWATPEQVVAAEEWPPPAPKTFTSEVQPVEPRTAAAAGAGPPTSARSPEAAAPPAADKKRLARAFEAFALPVSTELLQRAVDARASLQGLGGRTTLVYFEILGVPAASPLRARCLARAITTALDFGGCVETLDEDAAVLAFCSDGPTAPGRAMLAALELRDIVADEARLTTPPEPIAFRAALTLGKAEFPAGDAPYEGELLARARALSVKTPAGKLAGEPGLRPFADALVEVGDVPGQVECLELYEARALLPPNAPRLLGREALLGQLDKRLSQIGTGIALPVLVTGPAGAGKSTLAHELTLKARHHSVVVGMAYGLRSLKGQPFAALTEVLCNVCGVPKDQRHSRLRSSLEALKIAGPELAAALVLGGVEQLPQPFTPGQAIAALRTVIAAGAAGRKVLLVFDGLESMDSWSVEAFRTLCAHPAPRELTVGFADRAFADENLPNLPRLDLPALTNGEVRQWTTAFLGNAPADEALLRFLVEQAAGLPGRLVDWLQLLASRGWLRLAGGTFTLPETPVGLEPEQLPAARVRALGPAAARIFQAACLCPDAASSALLAAVLPDMPPSAYQRLVNSRMVRALGGRRWLPADARLSELVAAHGSPVLHRRLAQSLLDEARAANLPPDAALLAAHLSKGGDTARALPLWRHAAEAAVSRRAPRDLLVALKGWSDAIAAGFGAAPPTGESIRARADSLARASAIALVGGDPGTAKGLAGEAEGAAKAGMIESAEVALASARVLRSEARRARAAEALAVAEKRAGNSPVLALCLVERGEARESEGDLAGAAAAFQKALTLAEAARDFARWHGEIDLRARVEARLAGVLLAQKNFAGAQTLLVAALEGWRKAGFAWGESRVLANLGTLKAQSNEFAEASRWFAEAVSAGGRCGDLLFQARTLLNLARVERRVARGSEKANADRARRIAVAIGWEDGRKQAESLTTG